MPWVDIWWPWTLWGRGGAGRPVWSCGCAHGRLWLRACYLCVSQGCWAGGLAGGWSWVNRSPGRSGEKSKDPSSPPFSATEGHDLGSSFATVYMNTFILRQITHLGQSPLAVIKCLIKNECQNRDILLFSIIFTCRIPWCPGQSGLLESRWVCMCLGSSDRHMGVSSCTPSVCLWKRVPRMCVPLWSCGCVGPVCSCVSLLVCGHMSWWSVSLGSWGCVPRCVNLCSRGA